MHLLWAEYVEAGALPARGRLIMMMASGSYPKERKIEREKRLVQGMHENDHQVRVGV